MLLKMAQKGMHHSYLSLFRWGSISRPAAEHNCHSIHVSDKVSAY